MAILCENCKQQVATDSSIPVTEEWLREEWGFIDEEIDDVEDEHYIMLKVPNTSATVFWSTHEKQFLDNMHCCVTTRYQFRLLAAALGIPKKGE